jgi:drug/metabolite transporter (DMT)-like permease
MTYPVFVFAVAPFVTGERPKLRSVLLLAITFVGVWNVIRPADLSSLSGFALGDLLAFGSAVTAGFAIAALRRARSTDSTATIVFYVMAVGAVVNLAVVFSVPAPSPEYLLIAVGAGLMGTLGQITLTIGFAHVSAPTGSLLSTSRILVAMIFGVIFFGDSITYRTVIGALIIIGSLVAAALTDRGRVEHAGKTS